MEIKRLFILILIVYCSCNNSSNDGRPETDSLHQLFSKISNSSLTNNLTDSNEFDKLPYWDSTKDRYSDAYIDTFSAGTSNFKFVNPIATHRTGDNAITLQQLINGKWLNTNIILGDNIHGATFGHDKDLNGDGYNDIYNTTRFTADVYFFNPTTNTFLDSALSGFNLNCYQLDKSKNIYCDFQDFKQTCGDIHSMLYTFEGFKKYTLYDLELYNCSDTENDKNLITKLILNRCVNGNVDSTINSDTTNLVQAIDVDGYDDHGKYPNGSYSYFDYIAYWKSKYQTLLSNR